jgi:hypothetical protein
MDRCVATDEAYGPRMVGLASAPCTVMVRLVMDSRRMYGATVVFLTVSSCKPLNLMYVRGGQTRFGGFWGKKSYRDVR